MFSIRVHYERKVLSFYKKNETQDKNLESTEDFVDGSSEVFEHEAVTQEYALC